MSVVEMVLRVIAWALVLFVVVRTGRPSQRMLQKFRDGFTRRTGAFVDPVFIPAFDRETRRMLRWLALLVFGLGVVVELLLDVSDPLPVTAPFATDAVIPALWLAAFSVSRLRSAGREFAVSGARSSVAHVRRVVVGDYVGWPFQTSIWLFVALDVVLAATSLQAWDRGEESSARVLSAVTSVGITLCMAGATAWFAHVLCQRPTPAVDPSHLYLQDAWRARTLSGAYTLVAVSAFYSFLGVGFTSSWDWVADAMELASYPAIGVGMVVAVLQWKWFRRRLWSGLAQGQTLLPGQPFPSGSPT